MLDFSPSILTRIVTSSIKEPAGPSYVAAHPNAGVFVAIADAIASLTAILNRLSNGMYLDHRSLLIDREEEEKRSLYSDVL